MFLIFVYSIISKDFLNFSGMGGNQAWVYNDEDKTIRHMNTNKCLSTQKNNPNQPKLTDCNPNSSYQLWTMGSKFKWQAN